MGEPKINPAFLTLDNVTLLPHVGSASVHTRDAMGQLVVDNLAAYVDAQAAQDAGAGDAVQGLVRRAGRAAMRHRRRAVSTIRRARRAILTPRHRSPLPTGDRRPARSVSRDNGLAPAHRPGLPTVQHERAQDAQPHASIARTIATDDRS